jgi:uncharacterized protein (DUF952 family)
MATIFHLALASDWAAAQEAGQYTISSRGKTLAEEGFIHASRADQWPKVRERFYGDVTEPLLLLQIDTDRLGVPLIEEPPAPGVAETFPHIYGPLAVSAVVRTIPLGDDAAPVTARPEGSFGSFFLREMYRNMTLVLLVMVCVMVGYAVSTAFGGDTAQAIGILLGLVGGVLLARAIYVRRRD